MTKRISYKQPHSERSGESLSPPSYSPSTRSETQASISTHTTLTTIDKPSPKSVSILGKRSRLLSETYNLDANFEVYSRLSKFSKTSDFTGQLEHSESMFKAQAETATTQSTRHQLSESSAENDTERNTFSTASTKFRPKKKAVDEYVSQLVKDLKISKRQVERTRKRIRRQMERDDCEKKNQCVVFDLAIKVRPSQFERPSYAFFRNKYLRETFHVIMNEQIFQALKPNHLCPAYKVEPFRISDLYFEQREFVESFRKQNVIYTWDKLQFNVTVSQKRKEEKVMQNLRDFIRKHFPQIQITKVTSVSKEKELEKLPNSGFNSALLKNKKITKKEFKPTKLIIRKREFIESFKIQNSEKSSKLSPKQRALEWKTFNPEHRAILQRKLSILNLRCSNEKIINKFENKLFSDDEFLKTIKL